MAENFINDGESGASVRSKFNKIFGGVYLGQVGCRTRIPDQINAGITSMMARRADFARDEITSLQLVYGNFYTTPSGEAAPGAARTITADIEYPAGVYTRVKFGAANSISIADGAAQAVSDPVAIAIPKGAQFWVNTYQQCSAGIIFLSSFMSSSLLGDRNALGAADGTMTNWSGSVGGASFGPNAIIATTREKSASIVSDSRSQNVGGTASACIYGGNLSPSLAPFMAVLDLSRGSQSAQTVAGSGFDKRKTYLQYCSHGVLGLGINDIIGGRNDTDITNDRQTIRGYAPLMWFETTLEPRSTSTDSWATLNNQTTSSGNGNRVNFNNRVRAGNVGFMGYFELADAVESYRDSGIFKAPPMVPRAITADGVHDNDDGYALHPPYINPSMIRR